MSEVGSAKRDIRGERNLQLLRRLDASVSSVICYAAHVVLYSYRNSGWERDDMEGALFIAERSDGTNRLFVINRVQLSNLVQDIDKDFIYEDNNEYLMYKHGDSGVVKGIWFGKAAEREAITETLNSITKPKPKPATTNNDEPSLVLSKSQLQETLMNLLREDRFISMIHDAYLKNVRK